jgi:hypothetical protein
MEDGELQVMRRAIAHRRTLGERGAALVEAAFVFPLAMCLVLGIIEYGMQLKDANSVAASTRSGARTASAEARQATYPTDAAAAVAKTLQALPNTAPQELWIYRAGPQGFPCSTGSVKGADTLSGSTWTYNGCPSESTNFSACGQCVKFTWDTSVSPPRWTQSGTNTWPSTDQNACQAQANSVGIYLKAKHDLITHWFDWVAGSQITLSDHTVMRLEPIPAGAAGGCS